MGTRYIIEVTCPECGVLDDGVYYAPSCGFTTHECACGHVTDLEEHTGISREDASNTAEIERIVSGFQKREHEAETGAVEESGQPPETGDTSFCTICGKPIEYVGPYWRHTTYKPRHLAMPLRDEAGIGA